jgi:hypothetical protein
MKPVYHANALELLRSHPDSSNLSSVARGEERLGLGLPAAVREFYANPELTALVDREGGDHLCPLEGP